MTKFRILIFFILIISPSLPLYGLTWKEFLDAFQTQSFNFPPNARNKQVTCWKEVYWEEYIEGNYENRGYVNSYQEKIKINCPY